jgi:hypothetical protein
MALLDDARRWIKDRFVTDEHITMTPKAAIRQLETALPELSAGERQRNIDHLKYYSQSYYQGRHQEPVPAEVNATFAQLEREAARLNLVDRAREVVANYGGPPTRQTIADALERSARERATRLENAAAKGFVAQGERVSEMDRITPQRAPVAVAQAPLRAHSREVAQHLEHVPNAPGETVARAAREANPESTPRVSNQRGNKREVAQERGIEMGV